MIYLMGMLAVFLVFFVLRKFTGHATISKPFWTLGFFKLHYLIAGIFLYFFFPNNFIIVFEPARIAIITFSLCWIGLYYGCGLELRVHQRFSSRIIFSNILEPVVVFSFISIGSILYLYIKADGWHHTETALMIGLFSSFTIFRRRGILYRESYFTHHPVLDNLLPIGNIFPVTMLAVMSRLHFENLEITILDNTFTSALAFFLLQILTGVLGGMLINILVSSVKTQENLAVIIIGGTAFVGGIAATFSFSPLFVGAVTGAFFINSTLKRLQVLEVLNSYQEYIEKIFMFCLGAMITPLFFIGKSTMFYIFACSIGLFLTRAVLKYILCTLWISRNLGETNGSPILWIGLTGQGILATGAVIECSQHAQYFTAVFSLFILLLIFNQIAIGMYVWITEKDTRVEGNSDA